MGEKSEENINLLTDYLLNKIKNAQELQDTAQAALQSFWDFMEATAVVIDENGKPVSFSEKKGNLPAFSDSLLLPIQSDPMLSQFFKSYNETGFNISLSKIPAFRGGKYDEFSKIFFMVLPVFFSGKRLGTAIILSNSQFSQEKIRASKILLMLLSNSMGGLLNLKALGDKQKNMAVKSALSTLSYSELEAAIHVFETLGSSEGLVTTSKIADAKNLTRSVIVNSLRKLEAAGLIESRSLGMKGTFIKILNEKLTYELNKLRH